MSFFQNLAKAKADAYSHMPQIPSMIPTGSGDSVQVTVDGQPKTLYVVTPDGISGGSGIGIPHNTRGYFSETPNASPENFFTPNLLGGSVEYDVDLSQMECGCIAAFYTVSMPAKDQSGNYVGGDDGLWYCDANQVGGTYCPEFDIMEANKYAYQTTPHSCNAPNDKGHYDYCNRSGACWQNSKDQLSSSQYGPGAQIDTTQPFHVKIDFNTNGTQFGAFSTTMTQNGNTVNMTGDCGTNAEMSWDIANGMAFAFSNWQTDDSWLWGNTCYGSCSNNPFLSINNFVFTTGSVEPGPGPEPSGYTYGDACGSKSDGQCDGSCDCRWSWPSDDPAQWASQDADCRCKA